MNRFEITALIIYLTRQILTLFSIYHWNNDIQSSIIPALRCWYCQPSNAPYGILWYIISYPGIFHSETIFGFVTYMNTIDSIAMLSIRKHFRISTIYQICSIWIWLQAPYDLPILWLTLLGLRFWPLALLGPLAKLPFGGPIATWNFILSKPYNTSDLQYYVLMGIVFISVLIQKAVTHRLYSRDPSVSIGDD